MLDAAARRLIDPPLNTAGRWLARTGATPDMVTLAGLCLGLACAVAVALGAFALALVLLILSRLADGLDGAVARATRPSDYGGYLDIVSDFLFYGAVPFGFVLVDPGANAVAGAFLLWSFYFNGASFLGYAILAERHDLRTAAQGVKSLYYSNGLLEGTETILFFVLLCILPGYFPQLAWAFGTLCFASGALRLWGARAAFRSEE
ncbi:Inner membrane protein YnjF [Roseivivax jejudonensis]|uniref:Inner membrane protein YnjF n=1 Tax=Roseivivax jejudonensis TaxID=1529041 RepID=A0A1X6YL37_9RHOB|nr:CDP-alcohol phosphatidyltransferase family protein [Roseivivax jejudonensis]SLN24336.1 Inner membrane protein YnjF [Roseivivax jejudonensis]